MLLIGFGYKARQGKNSAALAVLNASPLDSHARLYAFADALRAEVAKVLKESGGLAELVQRGWFIGDGGPRTLGNCKVTLPAWVKDEIGKPRTLLQWWGTDYRRTQDANYWTDRLKDTLERDKPEMALVTDVRFPNEVDAIHALGGYVVKVVRTTPPDVKVPAHPSENELDGFTGWDFTIEAANLPDLRKKAIAIYRQLEKK